MEHIVQFAINFDDQRITRMVEENAQRAIIADLEQKVNDRIFNAGYYGGHGDPKNGFSSWMDGRVEGFLSEHKDVIIETAGRFLAEKLSRTKAVKELLKMDGGAEDEN